MERLSIFEGQSQNTPNFSNTNLAIFGQKIAHNKITHPIRILLNCFLVSLNLYLRIYRLISGRKNIEVKKIRPIDIGLWPILTKNWPQMVKKSIFFLRKNFSPKLVLSLFLRLRFYFDPFRRKILKSVSPLKYDGHKVTPQSIFGENIGIYGVLTLSDDAGRSETMETHIYILRTVFLRLLKY